MCSTIYIHKENNSHGACFKNLRIDRPARLSTYNSYFPPSFLIKLSLDWPLPILMERRKILWFITDSVNFSFQFFIELRNYSDTLLHYCMDKFNSQLKTIKTKLLNFPPRAFTSAKPLNHSRLIDPSINNQPDRQTGVRYSRKINYATCLHYIIIF